MISKKRKMIGSFREFLESIFPKNRILFFGTDLYNKLTNLLGVVKKGYKTKDPEMITRHLSSENIETTTSFEELDKLIRSSYENLDEVEQIYNDFNSIEKKLNEAEDVLL